MPDLERILATLTLEEKVKLISGASTWRTHPLPDRGIPVLKVSDGPHGVRGDGGATAVSFPVGIALASSWNADLLEQVGGVIAEEAKSKDVQVVLGPTINLQRRPTGGRTFECYSEDPWLSGKLAIAFTDGLQRLGVGACLKHYLCNDAEFERMTVSAEVDERTLREVYLRPFEMAIQASRPWTVMAAYNRVNGVWACSHDWLLNQVLKGEWGFEGVVISDWHAAHETKGNALGGLDLEMPGPTQVWGAALVELVRAGEVPEALIDDKVRRLLRVLEWSGRFDAPEERPEQALDRPEHRGIAYQAAVEGMVLLKNDGVLPLQGDKLRKVALIGPNAHQFRIMGGGSSTVNPHYAVAPLEALMERLPNLEVTTVAGCLTHKYVPGPERRSIHPALDSSAEGLLCRFYEGESETPVQERVIARSTVMLAGPNSNDWNRAELTGYYTADSGGEHELGLFSTGKARLFVDGELLIDNWNEIEPGEAFYLRASTEKRAMRHIDAGSSIALRIEYAVDEGGEFRAVRYGILPPQPEDGIGDAVAAARDADAVILLVGTNDDWETEGNDRESMALPGEQDRLIEEVLAANPNTVVVSNTGSPPAMPWFDAAPAILQSWFAGQESGRALVDLLLGHAVPSGKLPITFPRAIEDTAGHGTYVRGTGKVPYREGVHVGHRWFDREGIEPLLPFGYGLSYTRFDYLSLAVLDTLELEEEPTLGVIIRNAGEYPGQETVQLYVEPVDSPVDRPVRELRGFQKVALAPGEEAEVIFTLDRDSFRYWDEKARDWTVSPGIYRLHAASSSRDLRLSAEVELLG